MSEDQPSEQQDAPTLADLLSSDVKLIHFTDRKIEKLHSRASQKVDFKPDGFWFSIEGNGDGWKNWSEAEEFELHRFELAYEVALSKEPDLIYLACAGDIDWFHYEYGGGQEDYLNRRLINWEKVASDCKGIIIAPYVWSRRHEYIWYYGWDCASGCIWDTSAIEALEKMDI